jgi:hypothetical protein
MDYHLISVLKSLTFIVMFVLPSYLFIPKSVHFWELWHKTKKPVHLSNAVAHFMAAFFLYAGVLMIMIMRLGGWA